MSSGRAILQRDIEARFEQEVVAGPKQEDGSEVCQRKGTMRTVGFAKLHLGVSDHREVMSRVATFGYGMDRLYLRGRLGFLLSVDRGLLGRVQTLLQALDLLLVLFMD